MTFRPYPSGVFRKTQFYHGIIVLSKVIFLHVRANQFQMQWAVTMLAIWYFINSKGEDMCRDIDSFMELRYASVDVSKRHPVASKSYSIVSASADLLFKCWRVNIILVPIDCFRFVLRFYMQSCLSKYKTMHRSTYSVRPAYGSASSSYWISLTRKARSSIGGLIC